MKLRVLYGVNGNLLIGYYGYYGIYIIGVFYNGKFVLWEDVIVNFDLIWEKNYVLNLGVDLSLFRWVNLIFDWYIRMIKDLLMSK